MTAKKPTARELYEGVCIKILAWMIDARPPLQEVGALFGEFEDFMTELSQTRKPLIKEKDVVDRETAARVVRNGGGPFAV